VSPRHFVQLLTKLNQNRNGIGQGLIPCRPRRREQKLQMDRAWRQRSGSSSSAIIARATVRHRPAPTRPATSSAATKGPISTKKPRDCSFGIMTVAPNMTTVPRVSRIMTTPDAKPDETTKANERAKSHLAYLLPCLIKIKSYPEGSRDQPQAKETDGANEIENSYHSSPVCDQLALQAFPCAHPSAIACEKI
jgi:hypothetical protein